MKRVLAVVILVSTAPFAHAAGDTTQPHRPEVCAERYDPVCAEKDGARETYSNACFAAVDQAVVVTNGQCPGAR